MKVTRFVTASIALFLALILWSCDSKKDKNQSSDEYKQAEESLKDEIEDIMYNVPSPSEIPYLLQATGAEFNQRVLSDYKRADQFLTSNDKSALNLGVYASDIGYLVSYGKTQDAINCVNASKKLAENLGILGSFDADLVKRFESNISKKDSLTNLLNQAIHQAEKYLKNDKRNQPAALILTGSFVEGLYISTSLIKSYPKNLLKDDDRNLILMPLIRVVIQQSKSVDEIVKMLSALDPSDEVTSLLTDVKSLQESYKAMNIDDHIKANRSNLVLNDKNLANLTSTVERLRASIIK